MTTIRLFGTCTSCGGAAMTPRLRRTLCPLPHSSGAQRPRRRVSTFGLLTAPTTGSCCCAWPPLLVRHPHAWLAVCAMGESSCEQGVMAVSCSREKAGSLHL
eukprot:scaffold102533_cov30-Tisochrysis_lutea.AAC.3